MEKMVEMVVIGGAKPAVGAATNPPTVISGDQRFSTVFGRFIVPLLSEENRPGKTRFINPENRENGCNTSGALFNGQ